MIQLKIKFFGSFRKYETRCSALELNIDHPMSLEEIKLNLAQKLHDQIPNFSDDQLVRDSALANECRVLRPDEVISESGILSILPPVCGG